MIPREGVRAISIAIAMLVVVSVVAPLAGADLLKAKWTYVLTGYAGWVSITSGSVLAYDMDGYLYVIRSDGRESLVSRVGPIARDSRGGLAIASPPLGDYIVYSVSGETGQALVAVSGDGEILWSRFVPGAIVALEASPEGERVAVAYRELSPGATEARMIITVVDGRSGEARGSFLVPVGGLAEVLAARIAVSDTGVVAVYLQGPGEVVLYGETGAQAWSAPSPLPPSSLCLSRDGSFLVLVYFHASKLEAVSYTPSGRKAEIAADARAYAVSPDCTHIAYYTRNSSLVLASLETGERHELATIPRISTLSLSKSGEYVLAAGGYSYYLYSERGSLVGNGYTLDTIQEAVLSGDGKAGVIVDSRARLYYIVNPEAQRLILTVRLLGLGVAFVAGLLLLIRVSRRPAQAREEGEDEEIYP